MSSWGAGPWLPGSSGEGGALTSGSGTTSGGGGGGAGGALTGVVDSGVSKASSESELLTEREGETRVRQGRTRGDGGLWARGNQAPCQRHARDDARKGACSVAPGRVRYHPHPTRPSTLAPPTSRTNPSRDPETMNRNIRAAADRIPRAEVCKLWNFVRKTHSPNPTGPQRFPQTDASTKGWLPRAERIAPDSAGPGARVCSVHFPG